MADESVDGDMERSGQGWVDEETFYAMESLQATLQHLEAALRQRDISEASSTEYCDNFCEALVHYAGTRNSVEHGLTLLDVYCLSINCFASARPHLSASSSSVALVLKRLALSCFELLLSVPQNEIPFEAWLQFHGSVQAAHEAMLEYGSTDLQALVQITGEGGPWSNPSLVALLTEQPTEEEELNAYLGLEGGDFLEMRIKHLEKVGEVKKALILTKACGNCSLLPNQATFRQNYVTRLCQQLPSKEAILEISKLDGKDVLEIICNMETEGDENTAFILCTTFLTQQLQKGSLYCSWELTLFWSKLHRRRDGSFESFLERCLQFGAIAKNVYHLLYLIRVIQTEVMHLGLAVSVELCVKALQLPRQEHPESKTSVCKTVACLLDDLEVLRACHLTEFFLSPSPEVFLGLEDLYKRPDQKYDEENTIIPNSLRCELLLALKALWPCDPEFWDWNTLKRYCMKLLGLEHEEEDNLVLEQAHSVTTGFDREEKLVEKKHGGEKRCSSNKMNEQCKDDAAMPRQKNTKLHLWTSERSRRWLLYKVRCEICQKEVTESRLCHHARMHVENGVWTCPICLQKYGSKDEFSPHSRTHLKMPRHHLKRKKVKNKANSKQKLETSECDFKDLGAGKLCSEQSSGVPEPAMEPTTIVPNMEDDDNDYITFDYINTHYKLQDREVYICPATDCSKKFKLFKYLGVHLKNDHDDTDPNVRHYFEISNRREKCMFCRRTFITAYHNQKHRRVHYGDCPYICVVSGCNAHFESVNKLIMHKHKHSFRLSYHCELKGCSVSFCDLGQLYHHEAQHFRDAAYTCTSPGCKRFYYSRQEFLKHIDTHGITFTEKDFEDQIKAKRNLLMPVINNNDCSKVSFGSETKCLNRKQTYLPPQPLECKDSKGLVPCVAVCFDGKTFTCGLGKCGRTFRTAREIQNHLKIVHPGQIKKETIVCKTIKDENVQAAKQHNGQDKGPTKESGQEQATDSALCDKTPSTLSQVCHNELAEIVLRLDQLSLNCTTSSNNGSSHCEHASESKVLLKTCPKNVNAEPQTKVTTSKVDVRSPQAASDSARQQSQSPPPHKAESPPSPPPPLSIKEPFVNDNQPENSLHIIKPFTCEVEGCFWASVTSPALKRHYIKKHDYTEDKVKLMDIFNPLKFKPFKCHICFKEYKEKKELKLHLLLKHDLSKDAAEQILCSFATTVDNILPSATAEVHTGKKEDPTGKNSRLDKDCSVSKGTTSAITPEDKDLRNDHVLSSQKSTSAVKSDVGGASLNRRVSKRLMTKVKSDEDQPYLCLHKGCGAGFRKKFNLLHHLQTVHCHRSNLCLQKTFRCEHDGCNKQFNHLCSLNRHYRKDHLASEEPIPRFKCTYPECTSTYHLKSSLMRHTNQHHQNQNPPKLVAPSSICKFKDAYRRCDASGPIVVQLQSAHKRERSNSGCQKKLIITSSSRSPVNVSKRSIQKCSPKTEENDEGTKVTPEEELDDKCVEPKTTKTKLAYRTPEEALQMCQDRCLSEAYPCMVQSCNSVVTSRRSLFRHYVQCHKMLSTKLNKNKDTLVYTAEQLEELIQKKSAVSVLPDSDWAPNGVLKMEYQAENSAMSHHSMSLHSVKPEQMKQEASPLRDPAPNVSIIIGADDVLYGESNGHSEKLVVAESQSREDRTKTQSPAPPLMPPPPLDLSPPSTLRINVNNASLDTLNKESKTVSGSATIYIHTNASLTRQPLRGKNSELSESLPSAPHSLPQKDAVVPNLGPRTFDMAAYKPLGFESSFIKFIKEKEEASQFDPCRTVAVLNPCYKSDATRRRGSFRHKDSVKENNLRSSSINHSRMSHLSPLKSLLSTEECSSIQNLRFILERALMGCGDQAIKQLQFLKPVVVLERPKSSASLLDLLPSETHV